MQDKRPSFAKNPKFNESLYFTKLDKKVINIVQNCLKFDTHTGKDMYIKKKKLKNFF